MQSQINTNPQPETITLFNRIPPKSAVYVAALIERATGWVVTYQNARIGSTLPAAKDKTSQPLPYVDAKKAFDKLVAEKMRGGYKPDDVAATDAATEAALTECQTGYLPQLLNEIEEGSEPRFITDEAWGAEEKFDGKRMLLEVTGGQLVAINRRGLSCGVSAPFVAVAVALGTALGDFVIDGEALGEQFNAFDILFLAGHDLRPYPFLARRAALESLLGEGVRSIHVSPLATTQEAKRELYDRLRREGREGIVFKRLGAPYVAGRPNRGGDQLKLKFVATATFIVAQVNTKRSVALELLDDDGRAVAVGNVTIPANHGIPAVGATVEVRYLYAFRGGSVYQPVYLGERDDLERGACTLSQLKFKADDVAQKLAA